MNRSESELSSEAEFEDARDHLTKSDPPSQAQSPCSSGAWGSPQKIQVF